MAKYRITSPSGAVYDIEAPDTATEDEVFAMVRQQEKIGDDAPIARGPDISLQGEAPKPELPRTSTLDAIGRGAADAITFGFSDELGAAGDAAGAFLRGEGRFGDLYDKSVNQYRELQAADQEQHPWARMGGQLAGGLVTLPLGSAGASVGRLAGEGAAYGGLYGIGSDTGSIGDRMDGGGKGALLGGGLGLAGGALVRGLTGLGNRGVKAEEVLDAASGLNARYGTNIRPLPAHVSTVAAKAQAGSEATLLGGAQIKRAHNEFANEAGKALDGIAGKKLDRDALSDAANALGDSSNPASLANLPSRLEARDDAAYTAAANLAGDVRIQPNTAIKTLDAIIDRLNERPLIPAGRKAFEDMRESLANGKFTLQGLRDERSAFGSKIDSTDRVVRAAAKRMWGALSEDISTTLRAEGKTDALLAYQGADKGFREGLGQKKIVSSILNAKDVPGYLMTLARRDAPDLRNALNVMSAPEQQSVRAGILNNLGRARAGAQNDVGDVVSLNTFLTNWNAMPEHVRSALFSGQLRTDINDFAKLAAASKQAGTERNTSNTANALNVLHIIRSVGRLGGAEAAAAWFGPQGLIPTAAASWGFGKLISTPGFARLIVAGSKKGLTGSQWTRRLTAFANRNPAIEQEIAGLNSAIQDAPGE